MRMANLKLSAQLYTVRDAAQKDMPALLKAVRAIGFTGVELAGFGSLKTAAEVRQALDDSGLRVSGAHVPLESLETDFVNAVRDQKTIGNIEVVIPYLGESRRQTKADWLGHAASFNSIGRKLADEGMRLSYHNHDFEFQQFGGQTAMDLLLQHVDPALMAYEVDVYWVAQAGLDPLTFLRGLGSRLRILHCKDRAPDGRFAAVGTGTLDFPALTRAATDAGVEWGVVEQDDCYGQDPLAVLKTGYDNLKKLGHA